MSLIEELNQLKQQFYEENGKNSFSKKNKRRNVLAKYLQNIPLINWLKQRYI